MKVEAEVSWYPYVSMEDMEAKSTNGSVSRATRLSLKMLNSRSASEIVAVALLPWEHLGNTSTEQKLQINSLGLVPSGKLT